MRKTRKSTRIVGALLAVTMIAAACGGDDGASSDTTAPSEENGDTTVPGGETEEPAEPVMRLTVDINPDAVWDDGTPITVDDFECTWRASLNTPGSISTTGYDLILSVTTGANDQQVVIDFADVYAPYRLLFGGLIKADAVDNCDDISEDFADFLPFSARPMKMDSWSPTQVVFVPNENYWGPESTELDRVVMVPVEDTDTQNAAIKAGEVDFIYPQFYEGITAALADPNIASEVVFGDDYEGFYLQSDPNRGGPFADPIFREAFYRSIDREAVFEQIYIPLSDGAGEVLNCGPIVPGPYCDNAFGDVYDPDGAATLLEDNGWEKDANGHWAKDGEAPEVRWIVNTGNTRRENTQDFLIPKLQELGFNVVADNCPAECYFQQRLPALDYDMAMYISVAPPDPGYLIPSFTCAQIPSDDNDQQGFNSTGWCNEEASALLEESDVTVDSDVRTQLIKDALALMAQDFVMVPLFQFPKAGFWRTDKLGGSVDAELRNYRGFNNFWAWEDLDGDGQIIIGAEQWPGCLNPVTECASSSWMVWTVTHPTLPAIWDTTNDGGFVLTSLVTGEPVVEILS